MKKHYTHALKFSSLLFAMLIASANAASNPQPLSVLILTIDNLRPDRMSVYGYEKDTTPYLKKIAEESVVFNRAFSTSAWTAPGMVSIFTGYYPPVHAQHGRFSYYDDEITSALKVLTTHGYETLGSSTKGPSHQGLGFEKSLGRWPKQLETFIEERTDNSAPFVAWAHITDVHLPYNPSEKNARRFNANSRNNAAIEAVKKHRVILRHPEQVDIKFDHAGKVQFVQDDIEVVRALYDAEVADVDERLERHLERMRETGLLDRTIVIISADHGEELFDHGWLGHASTGYDAKLYDELIRIPLIIRIPNSTWRGHFDAMVQGVDFMPTIFDLLGIDTKEVDPGMQGRSFLPVIKGQTTSIRDYVFNQTTLKGWTTPRDEMRARIVSVRSDDKKLIRIPSEEGPRTEAYDLALDPGEKNDIYSKNDGQFKQLEEALDTWVIESRSKAASLVMSGAQRRLDSIADELLNSSDLSQAVDSWTAIQTMEDTWGLEPDQFYNTEPYATEWQKIQRNAAGMIGTAMTCTSKGSETRSMQPSHPLMFEHWKCN
ncbi:MAG: sulfatase family protein [bacterium]